MKKKFLFLVVCLMTVSMQWISAQNKTMPNSPRQEDEILSFFTVVDEYSYSIRLILGEGISCNYAQGNLVVNEDDDIYLQFKTEDPELPIEAVVLEVNGVETAFHDLGDGLYTYLLEKIRIDYTIKIALKEFAVTIPEIPGVTTNPAPSVYQVPYGESFVFALYIDDGKDQSDIRVFINGVEALPSTLRSQILAYTIEEVFQPIVVTVLGIDPRTGNMSVDGGNISVSVENGELIVENVGGKAIDVSVYDITGRNIVRVPALQGLHSFRLSRGIYIVKTGEVATKVIVK